MKNLNKLFLLLAFVLIFTGCTNQENKVPVEIKAEDKPKEIEFNYIKQGSFTLGENLKPILQTELEKISQDKIIEWYFDPHCPACIKLESIMKDSFEDSIINKGMFIKFKPMAFMSSKSPDEYSLRASSLIIATAEKSPELVFGFMNEIMNEEFYPENETSDEKFKEAFLKIDGATEEKWEEIIKDLDLFKKEIDKQTKIAFNSVELVKKSANNQLVVPMVIIGNSEKALNFTDVPDVAEFIKESIETKLNEMEISPIKLEKPKTE